MAKEIYLQKKTPIVFSGISTADVALSAEGITSGYARVSAQWDAGALPRPIWYEWYAECMWQATPTQGYSLEIYIATAPDSDNTKIDGDCGLVDAALADNDMTRNLEQIGTIISENAAASEICRSSGTFQCTQRYISIVVYNLGGASLDATDSNFRFVLTPIYWQGQ